MHTTMDVQRRLLALGYDLGAEGADGIFGSITRRAVAEFQKAVKVPIRFPGTVGPKTLAALFGDDDGDDDAKAPLRPWFDLALKKKALHEERDFAELSKFLKSDGKTLGDPRRLPWCGDFVQTCIALTLPDEPMPANPYLARNWQKFGKPCEVTTGAVAVFWRGKRNGTSGHVGFVAGKDAGLLYVLGGNQSNAITVAPIKADRLLGCRWPSSVPLGRVQVVAMKGGVISVNEA